MPTKLETARALLNQVDALLAEVICELKEGGTSRDRIIGDVCSVVRDEISLIEDLLQ